MANDNDSMKVSWRGLVVYDGDETGATLSKGIELMETECPEGEHHDFNGRIPEDVLNWKSKPVGVTCAKCGRELDPDGPNAPPVDRPI